MGLNSIYGEILNEHNLRPSHKGTMENPSVTLEGVNPTCGDDIFLQLRVKDGKIENIKFYGDFFGYGDTTELENILKNVKYEKQSIAEAIKDKDLKIYLGDIKHEDFIKFLVD